jgi:excisionase family DNA binding protein
MPGFMTVEEVAEHLRISRMSVYRLVKAGAIPARKFGRSYRIDPIELEGYIRDSAA